MAFLLWNVFPHASIYLAAEETTHALFAVSEAATTVKITESDTTTIEKETSPPSHSAENAEHEQTKETSSRSHPITYNGELEMQPSGF